MKGKKVFCFHTDPAFKAALKAMGIDTEELGVFSLKLDFTVGNPVMMTLHCYAPVETAQLLEATAQFPEGTVKSTIVKGEVIWT